MGIEKAKPTVLLILAYHKPYSPYLMFEQRSMKKYEGRVEKRERKDR